MPKTNHDRKLKKEFLKTKKPVRNKKKILKSTTHTKNLRQSHMVKMRGRMKKISRYCIRWNGDRGEKPLLHKNPNSI